MFANIAYHKGAKEIFCFEPTDTAFECLVRNKPLNAHLFKSAVGNYDGLTTIALPSTDDTMGASIYKKDGIVNYAPIVTLDTLFKNGVFEKIDFLKIDCEGAEKEILEGISDENLKKVKKIALEYHTEILSEEYSESLIKRMSDNGFNFFQLFIGDGTLRVYNFWRP
ncbi:MAG: FkbM family methyltransferase, partial [Methanobacterium sp.]